MIWFEFPLNKLLLHNKTKWKDLSWIETEIFDLTERSIVKVKLLTDYREANEICVIVRKQIEFEYSNLWARVLNVKSKKFNFLSSFVLHNKVFSTIIFFCLGKCYKSFVAPVLFERKRQYSGEQKNWKWVL